MKSLFARLFLLTGFFLFLQNVSLAQCGVPTYQYGTTSPFNQTVINLSCGQNCTDIKLQTPHIKTTSDYTISTIGYNPFPYVTAGGTEDPNIYNDDRYSSVFPLPFQFCFYDSVFSNVVIGSNGVITFELGNAGCSNAAWSVNTPLPHNSGFNTPPCTTNTSSYPKAAIMGVFQDLDPRPGPNDGTNSSPSDRKIEWRVEGTAPCRRFIVSYYHIGVYATQACGQDPATATTFQMVLHESTGLIDVFIANKQCTPTSEQGAILGIHDWTRTRYQVAPGKNATVWTAQNEGYRFTPNGGASRFVQTELLSLSGTHIAYGDTSTTTDGILDINFPNICPTASSTQYIVRTFFSSCSDPSSFLFSQDTVTINRTLNLNATATPSPTGCGTPSGTITVTVPATLGAPPFTYTLDGGVPVSSPSRTYTFNNVAAGNHTVYVTDNTGCNSTITPIVVVVNGTLAVSATSTATACSGVTNGTVTVTVTPSSGTAPFTYSLNGSPFGSLNVFTNLAPGNYTATVHDAGGCSGTATVTVATGPPISASATSTGTSCTGVNNGTITVTPASGTGPWQYSLDGFAFVTSNTFTGLTSGVHFIIVQDALGCQSNTITVNIAAGTNITGSAANTATSCPGVNNATITVTATSGTAPWQYSLDGSSYQASNLFTNVAAGNHTVVIRDALGCISNNIPVVVNTGAGPTGTANSSATSCSTVNNGTITVTPATGTSPYQYSLDGSSYQSSNVFTNVAAGPHTIVFQDAVGCVSAAIPITVAAGTGPTGNAVPTATSCPGVNNGTITVTATTGTAPYQYSIDGTAYQPGNIFTNVASGPHTIVFQDANGCVSANIPVTVTSGSGPAGTASSTAASCTGVNNGTITVTPSTGTSPYQYSLDGAAYQPSNTFINVAAGSHTIVFQDATSCTSASIPVTVATGAGANGTATSTAASCSGVNNGTITVTATTGAAPYQYSLDGGTYQVANLFTNVAAGPHNVTVKDAVGCISPAIAVTVATGAGASGTAASTATSCTGISNGTITVTATAGTSPYQFSLDGGPYQLISVFTNVAAGIHTATVKDAVGCISAPITVTVATGPGVTASATSTQTSCSGVNNGTITVTVSTGSTPYQYALDGGTAQPSNQFTNVAAGPHTVIITDAVGCVSAPVSVTVVQGSGVNGTAASTATSCNGASNGTITVTPSNGASPYQYSLDGGVFQPSNTFSNVTSGPHNVVFRDAAGCSSPPIAVTVAQGAALTATVAQTNVDCNGNNNGTFTTTVNAPGTAPFQYSLDNVTFQASNVFSSLIAGNYTVYFKDNLGCSGQQAVVITQPAVLGLNVTTQAVLCNGQSNGTITLTGSGGTTPYQYSLDNITYQSSNIFNVAAGTYTVYIKDSKACLKSQANITIAQPAVVTLSAAATTAGCAGNDGTITATAGGGTGAYQYSIDGINFQASNQFNGVSPGPYTVTVKDVNGCSKTFGVTVSLTNSLTFTPGNDTTICEGTPAQLYVTSNATQYSWTPATNLSSATIRNPVARPTTTTQYTVAATLGICSTTGVVTVNVLAAPLANAGPAPDICFGQDAQLFASGGISYQWTPVTYLSDPAIPNPQVIRPAQTIQYSLTVTDANGCKSLVLGTVTVNVVPPIKVTVNPKDTIVTEGDQVQLLATSIGTSYSWTNGSTLATANISDPIATMPLGSIGNVYVYKVTASTAAGCTGEATITLRVYKGPDIYMVNAFTPNGDGKNEKFVPIPVGIKKLDFYRVYDRWGHVLFSTTKLNEGWDGKFAGIDQPPAVYVWVVQGVANNDKVIFKKGTVTLIR
jgi:gliding motility-associated-like protein